MDIRVARSIDDGLTWSEPAALNVGSNTDLGDDGGPGIATDGLGNWLAIWDSSGFADPYREDFDILVRRSSDDGVRWVGHVARGLVLG
jgi:hypothetical protein